MAFLSALALLLAFAIGAVGEETCTDGTSCSSTADPEASANLHLLQMGLSLQWGGLDEVRGPIPSSSLTKDDEAREAWNDVKHWLMSEGAQVNEVLRGNMTQHGGATIRGVATIEEISKGTTLLVVPRRLWLELGKFPEFAQNKLPRTAACKDLSEDVKVQLQLAGALAKEAKKGKKSFYSMYVEHLPSMDDFRTFLPRLMEAPLLREFSALPFVEMIKSWQAEDRDGKQVCFGKWKSAPGSPASVLTWDEVNLGLMWIHTRNYKTSAGPALIPGSDLLNSARSDQLNTDWEESNGSDFRVSASDEVIPAGREVYDAYCRDCANDRMLSSWGLYMEDNPNAIDKSEVNCTGQSFLQTSVKAVLDLSQNGRKWNSPRCRAAVFTETQGAIRCSLARLAWEYCAGSWGLEASVSAEKEDSKKDDETDDFGPLLLERGNAKKRRFNGPW